MLLKEVLFGIIGITTYPSSGSVGDNGGYWPVGNSLKVRLKTIL